MAKKRQMTEEQKKALVARLKKGREAKEAKEKAKKGGEKPEAPQTPPTVPDSESTAGDVPQEEPSTTSPKTKKKGWIGGHTLDKEPTG